MITKNGNLNMIYFRSVGWYSKRSA